MLGKLLNSSHPFFPSDFIASSSCKKYRAEKASRCINEKFREISFIRLAFEFLKALPDKTDSYAARSAESYVTRRENKNK